MTPTVSAVLVVRNEIRRIAPLLAGLREYVDEVVVCDQSSDDGTAEVSKSLADVFIEDAAHGYCEASRQKAHDASSGDWVLCLAADEMLSEQFAEDMVYRLVLDPNIDGYRLKWKMFLDGIPYEKGPEYRFYRRGAVRYLDELHTEPQPVNNRVVTYHGNALVEIKTLQEQIDDEKRYEDVINAAHNDQHWKDVRLAMNIRLAKSRLL